MRPYAMRPSLDRLVGAFLAIHGHDGGPAGQQGGPGAKKGAGGKQDGPGREGPACGCRCGGCTCPARTRLSAETIARLRGSLLSLATDVLSGPGGLAAWLRQSLLPGRPGASASLPLDVPLPLDAGEAGPAIPAHLRRAATARHPHCAFPGCGQPASVCQIHHLTPRSAGGPTALRNLVPLCAFHHLIVIHRWGWTLRLKPDGTTTATSPDGQRSYHSHGPPTPGHSPPGRHDDPPAQAA
jgi:HNH endonuclease